MRLVFDEEGDLKERKQFRDGEAQLENNFDEEEECSYSMFFLFPNFLVDMRI